MRTYLLAGASTGIGRALSEKLSQEGNTLYVITQHPKELQHLKNTLFMLL
jgi:short-subunit dehydrogenase involved in D-alanine esterification of teichoic acids